VPSTTSGGRLGELSGRKVPTMVERWCWRGSSGAGFRRAADGLTDAAVAFGAKVRNEASD